jgi:hypothetical protein
LLREGVSRICWVHVSFSLPIYHFSKTQNATSKYEALLILKDPSRVELAVMACNVGISAGLQPIGLSLGLMQA